MGSQTFQDIHWLLDVIQSADIGIIVIDRDAKIEVFNRFCQCHSGLDSNQTIGQSLYAVFPYLDREWFERRVQSVFDLGVPLYTTWEHRPYLLDFPLHLPLHHEMERMSQNTTLVPLRSSNDQVERVGIVIYDVTVMAHHKQKLDNAQQELLALSRTDALTQLNNRGYWQECLHQEFRRCGRGACSTLVMLDIDHFKRINDTYGHPAGDRVIQALAELIRAQTRDVDVAGRYGGEEFAIVLPDTDVQGAEIFCERLREAAEQIVVRDCGEIIRFTISLGAAEFTAEWVDEGQWLSHADQMLYQSKQRGRNCTTLA